MKHHLLAPVAAAAMLLSLEDGEPRHVANASRPVQVGYGGLDQAVPTRIYRFRNDESYKKLRATVDACAAEWISEPAALLMVDASPYVLVTEGVPTGVVADAIRAAVREAAGE